MQAVSGQDHVISVISVVEAKVLYQLKGMSLTHHIKMMGPQLHTFSNFIRFNNRDAQPQTTCTAKILCVLVMLGFQCISRTVMVALCQ